MTNILKIHVHNFPFDQSSSIDHTSQSLCAALLFECAVAIRTPDYVVLSALFEPKTASC